MIVTHKAASKGRVAVLKELVKANCLFDNRDSQQRTPLWYACKGGHPETVQYLLSLGCDSNAADNTETSALKSCEFLFLLFYYFQLWLAMNLI
jgi:ankyrin repeat protein